MMQSNDQQHNWYLSNFDIFEKSLNGESKLPIHAVRRDAISRFTALGFPTTKNEEWRFTNVSSIAVKNFKPVLKLDSTKSVSRKEIERFLPKGLNGHLFVFLDGQYSSELSRISAPEPGSMIGSLTEALRNNANLVNKYLAQTAGYTTDAFTALSTAFMRDGVFVNVSDGREVQLPIHVLYIATGNAPLSLISPRNLIIAGNNTRLSIYETYASLSENEYFTNAVTEIVLGENAKIEHDKLQVENHASYHIASALVRQDKGSSYISNSISLGGALVRNTITAVLDAPGCECTLNGLSLATGTQHIDNHTTIDHAKPNCVSHELYKSILDGKAKGVFNGKIFVRKDAQKTDAKQTNKTLLLSDDATIDTKPQLEIFADDVKCTHGATVGQLDEEQLFYLQTRGIGLDAARDMLTFAFAGDIINRIKFEPLRESLDEMLHARLRKGREFERA